MQMPGRKYTQPNSNYRYGFNGKENDKDISEGGQDYGMRISDNRLGRFLSVDPLQKKYPELTPYQFASNSPIANVDLDGLEQCWYKLVFDKGGKTVVGVQFQRMNSNPGLFDWSKTYHVINGGYEIGDKNGYNNVGDFKKIFEGRTVAEINAITKNARDKYADDLGQAIGFAFQMQSESQSESFQASIEQDANSSFHSSNVENNSLPNSPASVIKKKSSSANNGNDDINAPSSNTLVRKPTLQEKNLASRKSQNIVQARLESSLQSDEILVIAPRFYINKNGKETWSTPDFAIYNTKSNKFVSIHDAKNFNGDLTGNQNILNTQGGTFRGSSREPKALPQSVAPGLVTKEKTSVPYY